MFTKILIANRGEILVRICRTLKAMNIASVAVYSDADRFSPGVLAADEAVHIGPAAAAESYLNIDAIIAACKQTGAQAVHPGYGFLSERVEFARRLEEAGIEFIGPGQRASAGFWPEAHRPRIGRKSRRADAARLRPHRDAPRKPCSRPSASPIR